MRSIALSSIIGFLLLFACPVLHAVGGTQLVQNGAFGEGLVSWEKGGVGECPLEIIDVSLPDGGKYRALRAFPTNGPENKPWDNNIINNLAGSLAPGQKAIVSFWVRSSENAAIFVSLQAYPGADEKLWGEKIDVSKEWHYYEFTVNVDQPIADGQGRLEFTIGYQEVPVEISRPSVLLQ